MAQAGMCTAIGILRFDDRNRYGENGIPTTLLFGGGKKWIVHCKKVTKRNHWAKVLIPESDNGEHHGELVEILGPVGEQAVELLAFQTHFGVKPCRYPKQWELRSDDDSRPKVPDRVFSVDNEGTRDIDDALSMREEADGKLVLGIHVADVASRISVESALFEWSRDRGASAYDASGSVPMLPPQLAHDELSLNEGMPRNALTLWLHVHNGAIVAARHERTRITNSLATTYSNFASTSDVYLSECRTMLQTLSGEVEPEELIAWTMIRYNEYFGKVLATRRLWPGGTLRAQADATSPAAYVSCVADDDASHASLGLAYYAHCSSPIRRFADLANQISICQGQEAFCKTDRPVWGDAVKLEALNERCSQLHRYHATIDAMDLAYACREQPRMYIGRVQLGDDGECLFVHTEKRRFRVPLHDNYFAEPIAEAARRASDGAELKIELCGVLVSGRTRLRVRLANKSCATPPPPDRSPSAMMMRHNTTSSHKERSSLPADARAWLNAAELAAQDEAAGDSSDHKLREDHVNAVLGYNIDHFQTRCLAVIVEPDVDLLAMAPTGSGKTAVALMAILQAFARGKRAVYTSPIKALSNQKFSEFTQWFRGRGIEAHVSLLTGDVKIRAPPGSEKELIICTSEILRNKLVKASGGEASSGTPRGVVEAARAAAEAGDTEAAKALEALAADGRVTDADPDLERLGCVVSDEIHYINDVERGAVWEETLMHMPHDVQMVALSATLRDPENFLAWIKSVRGRDGRLVVRSDRHVPLHVGGIDPKNSGFAEFYCTHDDPHTGRKAGKFDVDQFSRLFSLKALEKRIQDDADRLAAKARDRAERDAEKQAQRDAFAGGKATQKLPPPPAKKRSQPGRSSGGGPLHVSFTHECLSLARALDAADKLPGIVFCMSRKLCVQGAHACESLNLLLGAKPEKKPLESEGEAALAAWEERERERSTRVASLEHKRRVMHRKHLQRYMPELGELEAYRDIDYLLSRGVAYHHSGMLPILREFVELCFQQRLVKLVFATETLAVGVNMPARTVVFSQLDKPDDTGAKEGHRWLRVDEFWQMAGRAGRRGLDVVGYVVYAPTLSVAGLKNVAPLHEVNRMLTGKVAPATSQLLVDRPFVLRHLNRGHDAAILKRTLRADELRRENDVARRRLKDAEPIPEDLRQKIERFDHLELRLGATQSTGGISVKVSQKELKKLQREKRELLDSFPGGGTAFLEAKRAATHAIRATDEIAAKDTQLQNAWEEAYNWLCEACFIDPTTKALTPRGKCAAAFSDGEPLILGTCIADGAIAHLTLPEVCAFLCIFIPNRSGDDPLPSDIAKPSANLQETLDYADELAAQLHKDKLDRKLALMMLDWCLTKDINHVAGCVDPSLLGSFVKAVMRVLSYVDVVREVLLGLGAYEAHNVLDHHTDALLHGLVTNESLYIRIDDE